MTNRKITGKLPAPTLAQRLASMSTPDLMIAAKGLAKSTDAGADMACTAVLEELEKRTRGGAAFEAFVEEIYS